MNIDNKQLQRYQRQMMLPGMGESGQRKLSNASVLILGAGGLSTACSIYLAGAGVGKITLIDPAKIEISDLNRQFLFNENEVGKTKVEVVAAKLKTYNANISIDALAEKFNAHNAESLFKDKRIIIDCLDNWQDKLLASDTCMQVKKPLVHAGITNNIAFHIYTMIPGQSACLRCVFAQIGIEDLPAANNKQGVFGPMSGMAGSLQALEAIKLITFIGTILQHNQMLRFDSLRNDFEKVTGLTPRSDCPDCGNTSF